jgi:hypothetical protein
MELTKKTNKKLVSKANPWNHIAFNTLKKSFTVVPKLQHFESDWPIVIVTDTSDFAIGMVLFQVVDGCHNPIAYHSRKLDYPNINYAINDRQMLAIVSAFKEWRCYIEVASHPICLFNEHQNPNYYTTMKFLNWRLVCWAQELA